MSGIRQYLLTVISVAILCGITKSIVNDSKHPVRFICGLIFLLTVVTPTCNFDLFKSFYDDAFLEDAKTAAAMGEALANDSIRNIIKDRLQSYIQDKANELGTSLEAEVIVSESGFPVPENIILTGQISPDKRLMITEYLSEVLGVAKEDFDWRE